MASVPAPSHSPVHRVTRYRATGRQREEHHWLTAPAPRHWPCCSARLSTDSSSPAPLTWADLALSPSCPNPISHQSSACKPANPFSQSDQRFPILVHHQNLLGNTNSDSRAPLQTSQVLVFRGGTLKTALFTSSPRRSDGVSSVWGPQV